MLVPVKLPWKTQPPRGTRLNRDHPAMKHCVFLRYGADKRDLLTGERPTNSTSTGDSLADRRLKGRYVGIDYQNADSYVDFYPSTGDVAPKLEGLSEITAMAVVNNDTFGSELDANDEERWVLLPSALGGAHNQANFYLDAKLDANSPATGRPYLTFGVLGQETLSSGMYVGTHQLERDQWYSVGGRWKSGGNSFAYLWADNGIGHHQETSRDTATGSFDTGNSISIGGRASAGNDDNDGVIALVAAFSKQLPEGMFKSLLENPWQLFEPRTVWLPYSVVAIYEQSVGGSLTPVSSLTDQITFTKAAAGAFTPAGAMSRLTGKGVSAALTPSALQSRSTLKNVDGSVSPASVLAIGLSLSRIVAGSLAPVGGIIRRINKAVSGTLGPLSSQTKDISKGVVGSISPAGNPTRRTSKGIAGGTTPSGDTAAGITTTQTTAGSVTPAGGLVKRTYKTLLAALLPSGGTTKQTGKTVSGEVAPESNIIRDTSKSVSGEMTPDGDTSGSVRLKTTIAGILAPISGALATLKVAPPIITGTALKLRRLMGNMFNRRQ